MSLRVLRSGDSFPPPAAADRNGLVAVTRELTPDRLVEAYSEGIFPWFEQDGFFFWFSPHPRMILLPGELRVSRSLRKTLARGIFDIRMDTAFREVVRGCATAPRDEEGTWISPAFVDAYGALHDRGLAHSVKAWRDGILAGGLYGVSVGAAFMGESMFARESDACDGGQRPHDPAAGNAPCRIDLEEQGRVPRICPYTLCGFARRYRKAYPKAVGILEKDWERLVAFYDFPEAHWKHLRTTNVVESPFASVRLRTAAAKRFKRVDNATAMIWKLLLEAEARFRRLNAPELLSDVYNGVEFVDGREVSRSIGRIAA